MSHAVISEFVYSNLASEPDLAELVQDFVNEIPERILRMQERADYQDWEGLRRLAHQIKGAAGSYGFGEVTPFAAQLESNLKAGEAEDIIRVNLNELIDICGRLRSGTA